MAEAGFASRATRWVLQLALFVALVLYIHDALFGYTHQGQLLHEGVQLATAAQRASGIDGSSRGIEVFVHRDSRAAVGLSDLAQQVSGWHVPARVHDALTVYDQDVLQAVYLPHHRLCQVQLSAQAFDSRDDPVSSLGAFLGSEVLARAFVVLHEQSHCVLDFERRDARHHDAAPEDTTTVAYAPASASLNTQALAERIASMYAEAYADTRAAIILAHLQPAHAHQIVESLIRWRSTMFDGMLMSPHDTVPALILVDQYLQQAMLARGAPDIDAATRTLVSIGLLQELIEQGLRRERARRLIGLAARLARASYRARLSSPTPG